MITITLDYPGLVADKYAPDAQAKVGEKGHCFAMAVFLLAVLSSVFLSLPPFLSVQVVQITDIPDGWMGLDIGPDSVKLFQDALADAKTVVRNTCSSVCT